LLVFFGGLPPNFKGQHHAKRGLTKKNGADKKQDASISSDVKNKNFA